MVAIPAMILICKNKWSNSGPGSFGVNKRVDLLNVGLISGDYCVK